MNSLFKSTAVRYLALFALVAFAGCSDSTDPTQSLGKATSTQGKVLGVGSIGNFVWNDFNGNGIQDVGEAGLAGITVTRSGEFGPESVETDANGYYLFDHLGPDSYTITVTPPVGFGLNFPSPVEQGTDRKVDSNANGVVVTLTDEEPDDLTIDFGFVPVHPSISLIKRTNGTDNNTAPGITVQAGSLVTWTYEVKNTGNVYLSNVTVTDDIVGPICVIPTLLAGATATCTKTGTAIAGQYTNMGSVVGTPPLGPVVVAHDPDNYTGLHAPSGSIGDFVWSDTNGNGVQDSGEPGIAGVTVSLNGPGGPQTATTTGTGGYLFTGLSAGCYTVSVGTPSGFSPTTSNAGGNPGLDSNGSPASVCLINNSSTDLTIDFGFIPDAPGIVLVKRTNGTDNNSAPGVSVVVGSTVTWTYDVKNVGNVTLTNVTITDDMIGLICVIPSLAAGASSSCSKTGTATAGQYTNMGTVTGTPPTGPNVISHDPDNYNGFIPPSASIGDFVWNDTNGNGVQDSGEPGIGSVTVTLNGPGGPQTTTTSASGAYLFTNLSAGCYTVTVGTPSGYSPTINSAGGDDGLDSNGSPASVCLAANNSSDLTIDFGFIADVAGITIVKRTNGTDNNTAPGVSVVVGSTVTWTYDVKNVGNVTLTNVTVTDDKIGLICVVGTLAADATASCSKTGTAIEGQYTNMGTATGTPPTGPNVLSHDPDNYNGYIPPSGSIGDFVWSDTNGNGIQDSGEPGIGGVTVTLNGPGGTQTATTSAGGAYLFTNLSAGCYSVTVGTPAGTFPSPSNAGGDPSKDSNGSPATNICLPANNSSNLTIDFGFIPNTPSITIVKKTNGTDNNTAPGVSVLVGSTVTWTYTVTNTGNVTLTNVTVTDDKVGAICVVASLASGASTTCTKTGVAIAGQYTNIGTVVGTPPSGPNVTSTNPDNYFGVALGSLGDRVWNDTDRDGIQDAGENGIAGVTVKLYTCTNVLVATTTTNASGNYLFSNLSAGCYTVTFVKPATYVFSPANVGNDATDSDANTSTGVTGQYTLAAGQTNLTVDAGLNIPLPPFTTFTQGGWGAPPSGNNPGALLQKYFTTVYGTAGVTIGGKFTLKFTSSTGIMNFLPAGSTAGALKKSAVNPLTSEAGVFAGQVLSLKLSIDFSNAGITQRLLGSAVVAAGPMAGKTAAQVLALAQITLGGGALPAGIASISEFNAIIDAMNNNYDNGTQNNGFFLP